MRCPLMNKQFFIVARYWLQGGNRELNELWSELQLKLNKFFTDAGEITPALLHGDLWGGNAGETEEEPGIKYT